MSEPEASTEPIERVDWKSHPLYGTNNRNSGCDDPAVDQLFSHGRLVQMPSLKGKNKGVRDKLLTFIAETKFEREAVYTEVEVNERLMSVYDDYTALRRYLVEDSLLRRNRDGSEYWLADRIAD